MKTMSEEIERLSDLLKAKKVYDSAIHEQVGVLYWMAKEREKRENAKFDNNTQRD